MANVKIRRGPGVPTGADLENEYELGWDSTHEFLYINSGGAIMKINAGYADNCGTVGDESGANLFALTGKPSQTVTNPLTTFTQNVTIDGVLTATASSAKYSDVAEKYETDREYETGIILMHGVETEGTIANGTRPILGVISTDPAYLMNDQISAKFSAAVVLTGRVPLKVVGPVNKGDHIVLDIGNPGFGKAGDYTDFGTPRFIGISLTNDNNGEIEIKI